MSTAKKRLKLPLLAGPSAFCHPLILIFFLVFSTLSLFILFASSFRSRSSLNANTAPLILIPPSPNNGTRNEFSGVELRFLPPPLPPTRRPARNPSVAGEEPGPYHNWEQFASDFQEMMRSFKIYVYPDALNSSSDYPFSNIFLPRRDLYNPKLGNYFSEHMFKVSLLQSSLITPNPEEAHFFFMPFSINNLRNDPRVRSESSIPRFIAEYTDRISREFEFWNASLGADHFYAHCHSVGREAASKHRALLNNAIQVTCSSSYFQRHFVAHKDVGLPQVWPRPSMEVFTPLSRRHKLVFFSGRIQNSRVRRELIDLWGNDTSMDIFSGRPPYPYEEGFKRCRYCLHIKGYEVNTARISDAIHYGCVPVIISNYYDLPFANILNWSKFSVIIGHGEIRSLKRILLSIPRKTYLRMYENLSQVRRHFTWHEKPSGYDSLHMTAYQLWLRRGVQRLSM